MIVLAGISHLEDDAHLGIKRLHTLRAKISGGIKKQPVGAALEETCGGQQIAGAPALIRYDGGKSRPLASRAHLQRDGNARGGTAARNVENVSGYAVQLFRKIPFSKPLMRASLVRLSRHQLLETQAHDAPLLFRGDRQLRGGIILKTPFENGKHLGGRLARCADDENVPEALSVSAVPFREARHRVYGLPLGPGLLFCRPADREALARFGLDLPFAPFFANLRMAREGLQPVVAVETAPYLVGCGEKLHGIVEGPARYHLSRPMRRSATGKQLGVSVGRRKAVQPIEGLFHNERMIVAEGAGTQEQIKFNS